MLADGWLAVCRFWHIGTLVAENGREFGFGLNAAEMVRTWSKCVMLFVVCSVVCFVLLCLLCLLCDVCDVSAVLCLLCDVCDVSAV